MRMMSANVGVSLVLEPDQTHNTFTSLSSVPLLHASFICLFFLRVTQNFTRCELRDMYSGNEAVTHEDLIACLSFKDGDNYRWSRSDLQATKQHLCTVSSNFLRLRTKCRITVLLPTCSR